MPRKSTLKRDRTFAVGPRDHGEADRLVDDLAAGALDLPTAGRRVHALYDLAFEAGAKARAEWSRERTAQLAEENRRLRERLVEHSLVCDPEQERDGDLDGRDGHREGMRRG